MPRLFVAVDLPDDVRKAAGQLKSPLKGGRWVKEEQLHLTLRFIGDCDEQLLPALIESLSGIQAPVLSCRLEGVGCFPHPRKPRVLWVGLSENTALLDLQKSIEQKVQDVGFVPETRNFSAHITLARLKWPSSAEVGNYLERHESFKSRQFEVDAFTLYESRLIPQGAIHTSLQNYALHLK